MDPTNLTLHIKKFNDKLKIMNQSGSKDLTLSAQEARGLHADIFELLAHIARLSNKPQFTDDTNKVIQVSMSGGSFK
jgi:uncharacterized protein YfkK (UPF0435 family)